MNKDLTLVVMAAGMGSRFGGLKQIEPVGPNGEFLIDYSVYDAIKCGFKRIVFVIKEENYDIFKETIGKRCEDKIEVCYAFQKFSDVPEGCQVPKDRVKPLGTAHAIYAAREFVNGNFAVINSDDFYGREAYEVMSQFLMEEIDDDRQHFCNVAYNVGNTMTTNGSVKRGVVSESDGHLTNLIESKIERVGDKIIASPLDGRDSFEISENTLVSMNMLGFTKELFGYIEKLFKDFFKNHKDDLMTAEFLIPDVIYQAMEDGFAYVKVIPTKAVWHGVTYKEDKEEVCSAINKLIDEGVYPKDLWK